ncbi:hypothetical protein B0H34DRAFT_371102 [Crassisporium funariophilum]|nr:hypothetical protein B0H34DRAFT_371102 [Crassisporium funariophilum]
MRLRLTCHDRMGCQCCQWSSHTKCTKCTKSMDLMQAGTPLRVNLFHPDVYQINRCRGIEIRPGGCHLFPVSPLDAFAWPLHDGL